ncbi:hypothetical protein C3744_29685 [Priestia megaterium]|uniref:Uncharacterized protein n=1 Tax=Priestia megaterium TaxID=1404 RepID=A0A3D8WTK2_PRIMG|nr:hypothetical protein C3744_29685 [Priestia megaterium]
MVFYMLGVGLAAFIFHEMDKRVEDVPSTPYLKVESPIERRLYKVLVLHGYPVRAQVFFSKVKSI